MRIAQPATENERESRPDEGPGMPSERAAVLSSQRTAVLSSQAATLAARFAEVCARFGERTALCVGQDAWTYAELDRAAERVGLGLRRAGVEPGDLVAIRLERSFEMVAAMLGVVKAGAAYLPIEIRYPLARVVETIADAQPVLLIAAGGESGPDSATEVRTVSFAELIEAGGEALDVPANAEAAAYVIYTSGSTGKPKGVVVSNRNVVRLLDETAAWFGFEERDVWTMFHSFAFDFSVWEMWGCLLTGGRLIVVPFAVSRDPEEFYRLLVSERVTVLNQTPSAFALVDRVDAQVGSGLSLRVVIFGGEALALGSLRGWMARHGDERPELVNMYGITETTVHVTYRRVRLRDAAERESLIGVPIPDMQIYLLDESLEPVAAGEEGEICVGGGGVAAGYLNRAELTAERFVADRFGSERLGSERFGPAGARLYRSGDMGRLRADGELVYLGRRDGQVKINGFRIETGEVEAALLGFETVTQACVVAKSDGAGGGRLVAYFTAVGPVETSRLSPWLALRLPPQMMPAIYVQVARFPLTGNGKVDRAALPEAVGSHEAEAQVRAVGLTGTEEKVAALWREVLGAAAGLDDQFFDVGGTSLLLVKLRGRLEESFARKIPVTWMFELTTVRAMAGRLGSDTPETVVANETVAANGIRANADRQRSAFLKARAARSVAR